MKTYEWSFVSESDYIFINVTVRLSIAIICLFGEMLRLFFTFIKHHITNAIHVTEDGDTVRMSFVKV